MRTIIEKLIRTEKRISKKRGAFIFFGVLKRIDLENAWDIVMSTLWFSENKKKDLVYIIENIKKDLTNEDLRFFARIILLKPNNEIIKVLSEKFDTQHKVIEEENIKVNDHTLKYIYVITSKKQ